MKWSRHRYLVGRDHGVLTFYRRVGVKVDIEALVDIFFGFY